VEQWGHVPCNISTPFLAVFTTPSCILTGFLHLGQRPSPAAILPILISYVYINMLKNIFINNYLVPVVPVPLIFSVAAVPVVVGAIETAPTADFDNCAQ